MVNSSLIFIFSFLISYLTVPIVNQLGKKLSILDNPNFRKDHPKPLVRLGGLAIYIGFLIPIFIFHQSGLTNLENQNIINIFLIFKFLFFFLGIIEDIFHISLLIKLISQVLISSYACSQGFIINLSNFPFSQILEKANLYDLFSFFISIIWIVGIVNAFNWVDGLDGLASGLLIITSFGLFYLLINNDSNLYPIIILLGMIGSNFGFILHNYHPAKIFMGDGGSFFIGSVMALFSINPEIYSLNNTAGFVNIFAKILILGLPLLDMIYVIINRIVKNKSPFFPDRSHFHHRLLDLGINHKQTVIYCYAIHIVCLSIGIKILIT